MAATYTSLDHVSVLFWFKLSLIYSLELAMIIQLVLEQCYSIFVFCYKQKTTYYISRNELDEVMI